MTFTGFSPPTPTPNYSLEFEPGTTPPVSPHLNDLHSLGSTPASLGRASLPRNPLLSLSPWVLTSVPLASVLSVPTLSPTLSFFLLAPALHLLPQSDLSVLLAYSASAVVPAL